MIFRNLTKIPLIVFLMALSLGFIRANAEEAANQSPQSIYDFTVESIDGAQVPLTDYRGKTVLIVNTASKCGFTSQYGQLEALYKRYRSKGFEVLAFPANNFRQQEPGTNAEIRKFCSLNFGVDFPLFAKISVKGEDIHPLYRYLTQDSGFPGDITWNFNKFLVDRDGRVVARYDSRTVPLDKEVTDKIDELVGKG